jgi:hypothetical protein
MKTSTDITEIKKKGEHLFRYKFRITLKNKIRSMQNSWKEVATGEIIWN